MQTKRTLSIGVAVATVAILAACGDPTGTTSGDELSDAEVQAILNELGQSLGSVAVVPLLSRIGATRTPAREASKLVPVDVDINTSAPCQSGDIGLNGSIKGDVDENTFTGSFRAELRWTFNGCVVPVQNLTVTVDGDPNIVFDADFTLENETITATGTEKGGFKFTTSDGRSGSCGIDLSFVVTINQSGNSLSSSTTGTICGKSGDAFVAYP